MKTEIAIIAVIAVAAFAYLYGSGQLGQIQFPGLQVQGGTSLSELYHAILDPMDPNWIHQRNVDCVNASGIWFDQADKIGCFSIPPGAWDTTQCEGPIMRYFENICNGIEGAEWRCLSFEAGCRY